MTVSGGAQGASALIRASTSGKRRATSPVLMRLTLRLRGGGKHKAARPRSWKEQSTHHAELRKGSIRKNRGKNAQEATYTKEARDNLRRVSDARRLREMEENEERKKRLAEERGSDFNHQIRLEYMRANEEADRRRAEKYQTLDDYSDSVERELEALRQKRGETRGLTVPDWREQHPLYWQDVDKEVVDELEDLSDPAKVWAEAVEKGNVWKVAAYNRKNAGKKITTAPRELALTMDAGGSTVSFKDGGGGGMQLAQRQAENVDPGPRQFEEASSSLEREEEEKEKEAAKKEQQKQQQRKEARKMRARVLRQQGQMERDYA